MKPVLQIHFRHSSINVQVQQIHLRIEFLQPLFNPLCHNMIGNANYSPALGRDMECKLYGHGGQPILFIPCRA